MLSPPHVCPASLLSSGSSMPTSPQNYVFLTRRIDSPGKWKVDIEQILPHKSKLRQRAFNIACEWLREEKSSSPKAGEKTEVYRLHWYYFPPQGERPAKHGFLPPSPLQILHPAWKATQPPWAVLRQKGLLSDLGWGKGQSRRHGNNWGSCSPQGPRGQPDRAPSISIQPQAGKSHQEA